MGCDRDHRNHSYVKAKYFHYLILLQVFLYLWKVESVVATYEKQEKEERGLVLLLRNHVVYVFQPIQRLIRATIGRLFLIGSGWLFCFLRFLTYRSLFGMVGFPKNSMNRDVHVLQRLDLCNFSQDDDLMLNYGPIELKFYGVFWNIPF